MIWTTHIYHLLPLRLDAGEGEVSPPEQISKACDGGDSCLTAVRHVGWNLSLQLCIFFLLHLTSLERTIFGWWSCMRGLRLAVENDDVGIETKIRLQQTVRFSPEDLSRPHVQEPGPFWSI